VALLGLLPEVETRVESLLRLARAFGITVTLTSGFRSPAKQRALYAAWLRRGRTGLPVAQPGFSTHEYGLAVDLVTSPPAAVKTLASHAGCFGLIWAGPSDPVHFDVVGFKLWREWLGADRVTRGPSYNC